LASTFPSTVSSRKDARPAISVVVVSYNTPRTLERCLVSLAGQAAEEILVIDCSDDDPAAALRPRFPSIEFHHSDRKLTIPELRRMGMQASRGEIVALIESWMTPCAGWVEAMREAHRRRPLDAAAGGPIAFACQGERPAPLAWADYFSEYGDYVPGEAGGDTIAATDRISGANCSYKRWALDVCRDLVDGGAWEPLIHQRLRDHGHTLSRVAGAKVCYFRPARLGQLVRQRFCYGREHGAEVQRGRGLGWRFARVLAAPVVPLVMLGRLWIRMPPRSGMLVPLLGATVGLLALYAAWALGEAAGIALGSRLDGPRIF
jgi:hypothetical protein